MISELEDNEILNFLMTSDFEGDYSPTELKYMLYKWRYFYRILYSNKDLIKNDSKVKINELESKIKSLDKIIGDLMQNSSEKDILIQNLKNRKLTIKERLSGKIITNENENKSI
jgi:hypothetical protein